MHWVNIVGDNDANTNADTDADADPDADAAGSWLLFRFCLLKQSRQNWAHLEILWIKLL